MLGYFVQEIKSVDALVISIHPELSEKFMGPAYVADGTQNRNFLLNVGTARVLRGAEPDAIHDLDSELCLGSTVDCHLDLGERSSIGREQRMRYEEMSTYFSSIL